MDEKEKNLGHLIRMENPMRGLLDEMRSLVSEMGVKEYKEVLDLLKVCEESVSKAVSKASDIYYS